VKTNYVSCQSSIPQTLVCFLDGKDFEEVIRYAGSLGGNADTMACMAGSIAEAYFGVPKEVEEKALTYLSEDLKEIYSAFKNFKCVGQVCDEL
jgi:ADP-ribosylglycohydrolase